MADLRGGRQSAQALVDLADDFAEGVLVQFCVLAKLADRSAIGPLLHQLAHHAIPAPEAPILPAF